MKTRRLLSQSKRKIFRSNRPSLNGLDRKLQKYLDFDDGFFLEAGANDGYRQSNTFYLERRRGWSGILVEGLPALYEECVKVRGGSDVYNLALVSADFDRPTISMHYADLMSTVDLSFGSAEETTRHIEKGVKLQHLDSSYKVEVPTATVSSILDSYDVLPEIDFMSLDVEGYEVQVLKGIDFDVHRPKYILVEARDPDYLNRMLVESGYSLLEKMSHHDYFFQSVAH